LRAHNCVATVLQALERTFGKPQKQRPGEPLDCLILTILSQNTNDRNRDKAFQRLKRHFPSWEDVLRGGPLKLEEVIRVGGLGRTKARRIYNLLQDLKVSRHGLTLEGLKDLPPGEAECSLLAIPGVGKKTARCVLLFALGQPAFPVDTHIMRVSRRMGWIPQRATPDRAHDILQGMIPPEAIFSLHLNLIRLGRRFCRPRVPMCGTCPIHDWCPQGGGQCALKIGHA
jgi:endonuclease-3